MVAALLDAVRLTELRPLGSRLLEILRVTEPRALASGY